MTEVKDGKAVLQEVKSKVKAGTGLILKGTAGETYNLIGDIPQEGVKPETNLLVDVEIDTEEQETLLRLSFQGQPPFVSTMS